MNTDALTRFRKGLSAGDFTLTQVADESGIPLTTLSDMSDESWKPKIFERLENLGNAVEKLDPKVAPKSKTRKGGAHATA